MCKLKRDAQSQSGYVQLTAQSKVKHVKPKSSGHHHHHSHHQHGGSGLLFTNALGGTHKRTKSQDSRDFLGLPMALVDKLNQQQLQHQQHQQMMIARASSKTMNVGQSATLPLGSSSIYSDNVINSFTTFTKSNLIILLIRFYLRSKKSQISRPLSNT